MTQDPDHPDCETELLAHLGAVQPHGGLLLCDGGLRHILAASVGVGAELDRTMDPRPGDPVGDWLPPALVEVLRALPPEPGPPVPLREDRAGLECRAHRSPDGVVVEWVRPSVPPPADLAGQVARLAADLASAVANPFAGAQALVHSVAAITGYDRVMVYRFHPDWSGEVIAEARLPELPPFLGLRYPASDIPAQARDLYTRNLLRVVADVQDVALEVQHAGAMPPDLSMAMLRSVSPIHVQYLRNMGVRATLTVSLLHGGRLWGMIACHHGRPRVPASPLLEAMREAGTLFVGLLDRVAATEWDRRAAAVEAMRRGPGCVSDETTLARLLLRHDGLAALADADGIAWVGGGHVLSIGLAPDVAVLRRLAAQAPGTGEVQATSRLGLDPSPESMRIGPAGMLAANLPNGGWLALFRREVMQEIHWAGNPAKAMEEGPQGRLSPRRSFALWRQQVFGTCRPWGPDEQALLAAAAGLLALAAPAEALAARAAAEIAALARGDNAVMHSLVELLAPHSTALLLDGSGEAARLLDMTPALATLLGVSTASLRGRAWAEVAQMLGIVPLPAAPANGEPVEDRLHLAFSPVHGPLILRLGLEAALQAEGPGSAPPLRFEALVAEDTTRTGRLSAALRALSLQAERARRARDALLRNAGHELLTPLNAIIGFADLLASPDLSLPPESARGYAAEILNAGKGMLGLVENLLAVARLESGQLAARPSALDLAALLRTQVAVMEPLFLAKPVRLLLDLPPQAPCLSDASLLAQAVLNLLSNALKFTPANGEVTCRLAVSPGRAEIVVTDTGPGVPPEDRARIFEPFEQADGSLRRQHGGAGLGLFIARTMVELMGGSLTLDIPPHGGSSFMLRLPTGMAG